MTARSTPVALAWSLTWCAVAAPFSAWGPAAAAWAQSSEAKAGPPGAPKAETVLRKSADLYKNAKSFAVQFNRSQKVGVVTIQHSYTVAFQRPNRLAVRSKGPAPGIDIISDGKTMFVSSPDFKYTEAEAPATIESIFSDRMSAGALGSTMLAELCAADPYRKLMEGVKTSTYSGVETLDGARAHHLKFTQDQFDWEIWVAADGDPLVRRVVIDLAKTIAHSPFAAQFKGQKMDLIQDYKGWQLDRGVDQKSFVFQPSSRAQKVKSFIERAGGGDADARSPLTGKEPVPPKNEVVMSPGMRITATTPVGVITVTAVDALTRSYTWEGATRSVEMGPRHERWYGSLGLYYPGPGFHWKEHKGIARAVVEEGQQHFKTAEEAMKWIKSRDWIPFVYRDDGLMVGWGKTLPRKQLNVEVWQILIDGKKPERLTGSQNDKIVVETVTTETSPLVQAVRKNDLKAVEVLLLKGADAKIKDSVGVPVLITAAKHGCVPIVEALLKKGSDVNARNEEGSTALLEAIEPGHTEVIKALLAGRADVNAANTGGGILRGCTPLMVAALMGKEDIVQMLLEKSADVKAKSDEGFTALTYARMMGQAKGKEYEGIIRRLQQAGADR